MEALLFFLIVLTIMTAAIIYLLFKTEDPKKFNTVFITGFVILMILSMLAYTSLPDNYTLQRMVSLIWPVLGVVSIAMNFQKNESSSIPKVLLSISLIGALAQTLFV